MPPTPRRAPLALATLVVTTLALGCRPAAPASPATAPAPAGARWNAADVRFMTDMIAHHAQAIVMSRLAPERTTTRSVRTLAARIINAQQDEIALMRRWLGDRGQPVPPHPDSAAAGDAMGAMHHDMGHAGHLMAGMLTPAQLDTLRAAQGREFDRLFLVYMIQHHRGAVSMVKTLLDSHGAAQDESVFRLSSDIAADQTSEVARMEKMLVSLVIDGRDP
jgi:uncharacterized protein (DUF305 family)